MADAGRRRRRRWVAIPLALVVVVAAVGAVVIGLLAGGGGGSDPEPGPGGGRAENLVDVKTVTYKSSFDDTEVTGLAAIPRGVRSRGCVIWQYGFRSTKEQSRDAWQALAALGLATFSIDIRRHGARGSGEEGFQELLDQPAEFRAMMRGTLADLRSAIDYLEKQPYCKHNVAYVGLSLGGALGTILAAGDRRVKAAAFVSTPGTWTNIPTAPTGLSAFDPDRYVGKIAPRPVLILSGRTDTTVPIANARRLQAAARRPRTIVDYDGGHDPSAGLDGLNNANTLFSFLLRTVVEPTYGIDGRADGTFLLEH